MHSASVNPQFPFDLVQVANFFRTFESSTVHVSVQVYTSNFELTLNFIHKTLENNTTTNSIPEKHQVYQREINNAHFDILGSRKYLPLF